MKTKEVIISLLMALVIGSVCIAAIYYTPLKKYLPAKQEVHTEVEQTVPEVQAFTIQEYLSIREDMREQRRIDNVFLDIPDVVLIDILTTHGTDLSITEVVYIYESNKDRYNEVMSGARAQKYLEDSIQKIPIDTLNLPKELILSFISNLFSVK